MQAVDRQETENAGSSFMHLRSNPTLAAMESYGPVWRDVVGCPMMEDAARRVRIVADQEKATCA